jgi:hypothetical protein
MSRTRIAAVGLAVVLALLVAGLAGASTRHAAKASRTSAVSGTITFDGIWT